MSPPGSSGYKSPKIVKIMEGSEYYGNPHIAARRREKVKLLNSIKTGIFFTLSFSSLILVCLNTVTLFQEDNKIATLSSSMNDVGVIVAELDDMIRSEIKPRILLVSSLLSYKLPNAILDAFKKSSKDLTSSLKGITIDLENLIDLYRSILGFDDDWIITPETQHLTCSLLPTEKAGKVFDKVYKARDDYMKGLKYHGPTDAPNIAPLAINQVLLNVTGVRNETFWENVYNSLSEMIGTSRNDSTINTLLNLLKSKRSDNMDHDLITTPTPSPSQVTHGSRKRRYVVNMVTPDDPYKGRKNLKLHKNVDVHVITNRVEDLCRFTKKILGYDPRKCPRENKIFEMIKCLTDN